MVAASLILVPFFGIVCASPLSPTHILHESIPSAPEGFIHAGSVSDSEELNLRLGLASNNRDGLEKMLYDVSTPDSHLYGQHLTKEQVEAFVAPAHSTVSAVNEWLSSSGLNSTKISPAGDWIEINVPASKANQMFLANFSTFTNQANDKNITRTLSYSIPVGLQGKLEVVHPTVSFHSPSAAPKFTAALPLVKPKNVTSRDLPGPCHLITPACLQALYGIPTATPKVASNELGVTGFLNSFAQNEDLQHFLYALRPDLVGTTFSLQTVDGGQNPQGKNFAGAEANLDIQYTIGLASGVPTRFISVGQRNSDGSLQGFLDLVIALLAESTPPKVLTTSYGGNEDMVSPALATRLCDAFMQLGARGTSIIFASGDGGVAGRDGSPTGCSTFVPTFPAGCPFITTVGATKGIPETSAYFSSGGFSNYFQRPSYQSAAVPNYLSALGTTNAGRFNPSGRGFPDVAAQGDNVETVSGGTFTAVSGTSCSSPIFASVVALLNNLRLAANKPPMGFLNPFLYSTGQAALFDVTTGSNPGCGTDGFPVRAFANSVDGTDNVLFPQAKPGWDPVTGLGTPNFPALAKAAGV